MFIYTCAFSHKFLNSHKKSAYITQFKSPLYTTIYSHVQTLYVKIILICFTQNYII